MPFETFRLYLRNESPAVSPAFPAGDSSQAIQLRASLTKGSTAIATRTITGLSNTPKFALQFVSDALAIGSPMFRVAGLARCSCVYSVPGSPGSGSSVQRMNMTVSTRWFSADGLTQRTTGYQEVTDFADFPPTHYTGHPYIDAETLRSQSAFRAAAWGSSPPSITYTGLTSIVSGDRLVITLGFAPYNPAGNPSMSAVIEYGSAPADPLSASAIDTAGHPFIDLYVYRAGGLQADTEVTYSRPARPTHRPERFRQPATADEPFLNEVAFG